MSLRLMVAVFTTLLWEAILVAVVRLLLPIWQIDMPLVGLITLMMVLAAYAVITYWLGSRVLRKKPVTGLGSMIGSRGKVVSPLAPEGVVQIKGELWDAVSPGGRIDAGEKVIVVGQDGLRLTVDLLRKT